jgi:flagellar biosynthetic protein FliO
LTDILQPVAAVILVLALLGGVLYVLRKRGIATFSSLPAMHGSARQMKVVERVALGGQHALHLVRVGERVILVATAPGSCQILETIQRGEL